MNIGSLTTQHTSNLIPYKRNGQKRKKSDLKKVK